MLHSKRRKGEESNQSNVCFQFGKNTDKTPTERLIKKIKKGQGSAFVFSYSCKTSINISERSRLVAKNNGSSMPTYIDRIGENMCSPTNKQATAASTSMKRIPTIMTMQCTVCDHMR